MMSLMSFRRPSAVLVLMLASALAAAAPAYAQFDARGPASTSTGGGGAAYVRSTSALFLNPANLALKDRPGDVAVSVAGGTIYTGGDLLQFGPYNEHFTGGKTISNELADQVLTDVFGSGDEMRVGGVQADLVPVAATYRTPKWGAGIGLRTRVYSRLDMNRGLFDLALIGTDRDRTIPLDANVQAISTVELSAGFSYRLLDGRLSVGGAPKIVFGTDYAEGTVESELEIQDGALTHRYDYTGRAAGELSREVINQFNFIERNPLSGDGIFEAIETGNAFSSVNGTGVGIDLGATYAVNEAVQVAASFTDIGTISWGSDTEVVRSADSELTFSGFEVDRSRVVDEYDGSFGDYIEGVADSLFRNNYGKTERSEDSFSTPLPAAMHLGATWEPAPVAALTVNGGASIALNNAPANLSGAPVLHGGAEYVVGGSGWAVPFRGGMRVAGGGAFTLALGTGVYSPHVDFNFGLSLTPTSTFLGSGGRYSMAVSAVTVRF
jgi:hypothetical protein